MNPKSISAFPLLDRRGANLECVESGMTLRDYFAAQALIGLVTKGDYLLHAEERARAAYRLADAMLEARQ